MNNGCSILDAKDAVSDKVTIECHTQHEKQTHNHKMYAFLLQKTVKYFRIHCAYTA